MKSLLPIAALALLTGCAAQMVARDGAAGTPGGLPAARTRPGSGQEISYSESNRATNISVMDLNTTSGLTGPELVLLTDKLLNGLVRAGYNVVERSKRDEILREQGFQQSGACTESSCLVEAGQLLGVHKIIGGTVGRFGTVYVVELRMIDVRTGKIGAVHSKSYPGDITALLGGMEEAVNGLSTGAAPAPPRTDPRRPRIPK